MYVLLAEYGLGVILPAAFVGICAYVAGKGAGLEKGRREGRQEGELSGERAGKAVVMTRALAFVHETYGELEPEERKEFLDKLANGSPGSD